MPCCWSPLAAIRRSYFCLPGRCIPGIGNGAENVRRMDHVAPAEHSSFYSSSRLTLNITRGEMAANGWCPSGRFFEAAACGTPLITDAWDGLDSFFDLQSELRVVTSAEDVEAALSSSDEELQSMADRARQRTLDEHSGNVRAHQLLQYIEEARSGANASMNKEVAQ